MIKFQLITKIFKLSLSKEEEPKKFQKALNQPVWCKAMKEELRTLEKNNAWDIVSLPSNKKLVGCK